MTSSFPAASSAPPSTVTTTRTASNNQLNRISATNPNQQTSSRFKPTYDNRRFSTMFKHLINDLHNLSISSNSKVAPKLSRIEVVPLPSARLTLQQPISSPGTFYNNTTSSSSQFLVPAGSILDPLVIGRNRPAPLPPPTVRNAIHRNAVSLNTLPVNQQNGTMARGRSQNSGT